MAAAAAAYGMRLLKERLHRDRATFLSTAITLGACQEQQAASAAGCKRQEAAEAAR